jgi:arylsulfatase A-like enzyme
MLTGRYPTQTGVLDNRTWFGAAHLEFVSLPKYFKQQGYASLRTGKIFHSGIDDTDAWTADGEKRNFEGAVDTTGPGQNPQNSDRIVALEGDGESHADYRFATRAIEFLEQYKDKPFPVDAGVHQTAQPANSPQKDDRNVRRGADALASGFRAAPDGSARPPRALRAAAQR